MHRFPLLALLGSLASLAACDVVFGQRYAPDASVLGPDAMASACLRDPFDGAAIDVERWSLLLPANQNIRLAQAGGQLVVSSVKDTVTSENAIVSGRYDVTGGQAVVEVARPVAESLLASVLALVDGAGGAYTIEASDGMIQFATTGEGAIPPTVLPYDPVAMKFWRILYLEIPSPLPMEPPIPTIHYDTSADGLAWANRHSERAVVSLAAVEVQLGGRVGAVATDMATVAFDNFQLATRTCPLR